MATHVSERARRRGLAVDEGTTARWTKDLLREHPALIVSAFYVAASVIGMFYSWAYLRAFGINVFNYAQISDFLLASLKEPFTWGLVALAFVLVTLDNAWSRRAQRKGPSRWFRWYASPYYRTTNNFGIVVLVFVFIFVFATVQARDTRAGEGKVVDVIFADSTGEVRSLLLGTTGQFVFLYDAESSEVDVHPIESIHSISFEAPPEPEDKAD